MLKKTDYDFIIVGGGFYGCCLALLLRSLTSKILLIDREDALLQRASRVNQARVHSGFHYPRSALTAVKSGILFKKFIKDWPEAIIDDFDMLYAIGRRGSKISAKRFHKIFEDIGSDIQPASASENSLFNEDFIEDVFRCREFAFDYRALADKLRKKLDEAGIEIRLNTEVSGLELGEESCRVELDHGAEVSSDYVFNVTYSHVNELHKKAGIPPVGTRHEIAELALVKVPDDMLGKAVTVMDGPFFSCMPYPSTPFYSLTHVRFTPHATWVDAETDLSPYAVLESYEQRSKFEYMRRDASRFMPSLSQAEYDSSRFEVKTILTENDRDDGRPILFAKDPMTGRLFSVLGGKVDNIYDLFEVIRQENPLWKDADDTFLF